MVFQKSKLDWSLAYSFPFIEPPAGKIVGNEYASDQSNLDFWKSKDKCLPTIGLPAIFKPSDYDTLIAGKETKIYSFNCGAKVNIQYWSITGGLHVPAVNLAFSTDVIVWLLAQHK